MTDLRDGEAGLNIHGDTRRKTFIKWIRGKNGNGPLLVSNGGSAQMKDIMKLAEETWGGLWAGEAEELPKFSKQDGTDY
eukprot:11571304-Heterocapsa_arctica.AAC.1